MDRSNGHYIHNKLKRGLVSFFLLKVEEKKQPLSFMWPYGRYFEIKIYF